MPTTYSIATNWTGRSYGWPTPWRAGCAAPALVGRTVGVKVRYGDFVTLTRSRTCPAGLSDGPLIAAIATSLLAAVEVGRGVRLLGVGVSNLSPAGSRRAEQMRFELAAAPGPPTAGVLASSLGGSRRRP